MLQKCTFKGSYSILSKIAVLEEENMKLLFITHECCISQNSEKYCNLWNFTCYIKIPSK